ncbi:MAG: TnsA endonuclease [Firmicutes bacterium]|nr:TnsA endonuclease [Bacillota bacterium]
MTETKIKKWLKEGRGQGIGIDYKPWLTVQDVPSNGRSHREQGFKSKREHTLLSDLENQFFNILEYSPNVSDIREQYPLLPIEETIDIADSLGIEHPMDKSTGVKTVMTTDFLVILKSGRNTTLKAWTVKYISDLDDDRVMEKFEIERRYWERQGVEWSIITELESNKTLADNIKFVRSYYDLDTCGLFRNFTPVQISNYTSQLAQRLCGNNIVVRNVCKNFDKETGFQDGMSLALFKHLVITRQIGVDMKSQMLDLIKPINITLLIRKVWNLESMQYE